MICMAAELPLAVLDGHDFKRGRAYFTCEPDPFSLETMATQISLVLRGGVQSPKKMLQSGVVE